MADVRAHHLEKVVDRIYGAVGDPETWGDVLQEIAEALGARGALIFRPSANASETQGFWSPSIDDLVDWAIRGDGKELHNPRPARALRFALGRAATESDLFSQVELDKDPYNREMIARLGYRWEAGGVLAMIDGAPLLFTTQRRGNKERFGSSELEAMEALFPHFTRAAQISIRLALARAEGVLFAFDQMACGGILLGHNGRVLKVNACAEQLMGKGIDIAGGRIVASNSAGNAALQGIIQAAMASEVGLKRERTRPTVVIERYESGPLIAYAIPLRGGIRDVFNPGKAVLVLEEPQARRQVASSVLAEAFGLTPAEVRVAVALAQGKDPATIAEEHRVSIGTIRSQLKSLMAKTDTHRQAELVTLVLLYTVNQVR